MKTHVIALAGHNRNQVGWIAGDLAALLIAGRTAFMVRFPGRSFPHDLHKMKAKSIRAATPVEIRFACERATDQFKW